MKRNKKTELKFNNKFMISLKNRAWLWNVFAV